MEILCFCKTSPIAPQLGGAELRGWECMRRWASLGHRVAVVSGRTSPDQDVGRQVVEGVEIHTLRTLPTRLFQWRKLAFLGSRGLSYARSVAFVPPGKWDIIRDDLSPLPSFYPFHARRARVPSVLVAHILYGGLGEWIRTYGPLGTVGAVGEASLVRGWLPADGIISASGWLAERLRGQTKTPVAWIPNGVDIDLYSPGAVTGAAGAEGTMSVLSVGRFGPMPKGQGDLVKAVSILARRGIEVEVTFIGDGPELPAVQREAGFLGVEDRCKFLGVLAHDQMPDQYRAHQAFVLSSYVEGLPLTFLEAMASGLAIVSTDIIAVRELAAASRALIYPPGDVAALAEHLELLAGSPDRRRRMGDEARSRAVRQFTWDETAGRELDLFEQLVQRRTARSGARTASDDA